MSRTEAKRKKEMRAANFIREVKEAVSGTFKKRKPKTKEEIGYEICLDELDNGTYERFK